MVEEKNHITKPNKKVTIYYEREIVFRCGNGDQVQKKYPHFYTFEMEPVVIRLPNGKLKNSWRSIPIERIPEDEVNECLMFEKWLHKTRHERRTLSVWEARTSMKSDLISICYDHIYSKNNVEYWQGILDDIRRQNQSDFGERIQRAKQIPMEEIMRMYGYQPFMGKICCPFHGEKSPSLHVYPDSWHCYGCGAGSSTIDFVMQHNQVEFKEAVKLLTH